ncbi:hypothetical protein RRG08_050645 [Elysia crispata]|uniref:Uncharacterized protein n=1 Tax=Elysia crispata TaxID=231223 RepID=A0AAE1AEI7_9GAST|nr:hypothetical protein RRG08_050645 [Elysia crispata]
MATLSCGRQRLTLSLSLCGKKRLTLSLCGEEGRSVPVWEERWHLSCVEERCSVPVCGGGHLSLCGEGALSLCGRKINSVPVCGGRLPCPCVGRKIGPCPCVKQHFSTLSLCGEED